MNKRLLLAFVLLVSMNLSSMAQLLPIKNVPSPEITSLGEYGTVPVSLYTGIPDISIPLYELKAGAFTLPLSTSYHLASVKPNVQPGCLGLGWSLQAGGYITRAVHGLYDEKCESNGYASGYYVHASQLQNMNNAQFVEATKHIEGESGDYYELSADEFSFSFCGYSGNFYYKGNGQWYVVSDQDIKVEFNPANGEGFINSEQLNSRIPLSGWGVRSYNNRFFNKFTLVTPDGCRYEFGGLQATEYSVPYYSRKDGELIPTSWKLSKITTVDKRVVEFSYDTSQVMCDLKYVPQCKTVTGIPCTPQNPQTGQAGMTGYLIFPATIKTIKTSDETLEFNYYNDYGYSSSFVDTYLAWGRKNAYGRKDIYSFMEDPAEQFHVFLGNGIDTSSDYMLRETIKSKLRNLVLHSIYIKGNANHPLKTIYFDYVYNERRKLSLITERPGNPAIIPIYIHHPHGYFFLSHYEVPQSPTEGSIQEYHFNYNKSHPMPFDFVRAKTDSWGYFSGGTVSFSSTPSFKVKQPSLTYTQAEVLEEIIYPTGGKSRFEYELNRYSKVVNPSHTDLDVRSGDSGGLRIKKMSFLNQADSLLGIKRYYYSEQRKTTEKSSGIAKTRPLHEIIYYADGGMNLILKSEGGFFAEVTNLNSPDVGYSCVIEEDIDGHGQSQGYVKHHFSNYGEDIYGMTHYDEPAVYSMLVGEGSTKPFTSRSMERGKLLSKEYYDEDNQLKKKVNYKYKEVAPGAFVTAHQNLLIFCSDFNDYTCAKVGTLTKTYTHACLVDSTTEVAYVAPAGKKIVQYQAHEYGSHKLLSRVLSRTSDGKDVSTDYSYAADEPGNSWMKMSNVLTPVSRKMVRTGTQLQGEEYLYGQSDGVPYVQMMYKTNNNHKQRMYLVSRVDKYGNPIQIEEQGVPVVLIWGAEGQRIIARIENATYRDVADRMSVSPESFSSTRLDKINYEVLEGIRHLLPESHFYIYKYTSDMRLESDTSPNGLTTFYKYDYLGKLRESYLMENNIKKILNIYDYHFYNSDKESGSDGGETIINGDAL